MEPLGSTDKGTAAPSVTTPAATAPVSTPSPAPVVTSPAPSVSPDAKPSALASLQKLATDLPSDPSSDNTLDPATGALPDPAKGAAAIVQPGDERTEPGDLWTDVPPARRGAILKNVRESTTKEVTDALMKEFGWAKEYKPEQVKASMDLIMQLRSDPASFFQRLGAELAAEGIAVNAAPGGDGQPDPMPEPDLVSEDGTHRVYSDKQLAKLRAWDRKQLSDELMQHVNPMRQFMDTMTEQQRMLQIDHDSRTEGVSVVNEFRSSLRHFKENEAEIAKALDAIPDDVKLKIGARAALYSAYNAVLEQKVFPTIQATTEDQVRANLRVKATAGAGAPAGGQPPTSAARPKNVDQLSARMRQMAGSAG